MAAAVTPLPTELTTPPVKKYIWEPWQPPELKRWVLAGSQPPAKTHNPIALGEDQDVRDLCSRVRARRSSCSWLTLVLRVFSSTSFFLVLARSMASRRAISMAVGSASTW